MAKILWGLTLVLLILFIALFLYGVVSKNRKPYLKKIGGIGVLISVLFTALVPSSVHQVEPNEVAIATRFGNIVGIRESGTHYDLWCTYTKFDKTVQKLDLRTASYSSDAQTMTIDMTIQFKIDPTRVQDIYLEYVTMESLASRIEKIAADQVKAVLSEYTAMQIIETRSNISPQVEEVIKTAVGDKYHSDITQVNLTDISFTDEFERAVEAKVIAEQEKQAAITKAEQALEVAKLEAEAKIETAKGQAEGQKIIAAAEAEASALKIVELSKSIGYKVNEQYVIKTTITTTDLQGSIISTVVKEEISEDKPNESTTIENTTNSIITTKVELFSTSYEIVYDETHTMEDLNKLVIDYIEYLAYLEKWNGELPDVVSGDNGLSIIVPQN
jgi:regulator of protease activity HflC (stomatin/prohibitin superfamily)